MTYLLLYLLAVIDGAFVGYRDAVGRNPLLEKRDYFRSALGNGIALVHAPLALVAVVATVSMQFTPQVRPAIAPFADTLLAVYGPYACLVCLVFGTYSITSYDVRSFITISAFGMLTLVRPAVIVGGAVAASLHAPSPWVWPTAAMLAVTMIAMGALLRLLGWNAFDWARLRAGEGDG